MRAYVLTFDKVEYSRDEMLVPLKLSSIYFPQEIREKAEEQRDTVRKQEV